MWRHGSGHTAERSSGPRKHAHKDAKVGKDLKNSNDAKVTTNTTHKQLVLEEKLVNRAHVTANLRLEAKGGAGPDSRARTQMLLADRQRDQAAIRRDVAREMRAQARGADEPDADDDYEDPETVIAEKIARAQRAALQRKREAVAKSKEQGGVNSKLLIGVGVLSLLIILSFLFT